MSNNISEICKDNLCISCGLCTTICQMDAISYIRKRGMYVPSISDKCINCGKCLRVCPGKGCDYPELWKACKTKIPDNPWIGNFLDAFSVKTKNKKTLMNSTSGGVVTSLVQMLLNLGIYDSAFLVEGYNYEKAISTVRKTKLDDLIDTGKSRYIPIMHTKSVEYIINNPGERVILVGTSCFFEAFLRIVDLLKLDRNNYFLIGLFCDRTMNYNVFLYFKLFNSEKKLNKLYFRTKEPNGWPGDVRLIYEDGTDQVLSRRERMKVKDYFVPERCLYCLDKLNQFADISIGDNYIKGQEDKEGSSIVIVRSKNAGDYLSEELFEIKPASIEDICKCQGIENREERLAFQDFKKSNELIRNNNIFSYDTNNIQKYRLKYEEIMKKLRAGEEDSCVEIKKYVEETELRAKKDNKQSFIHQIIVKLHDISERDNLLPKFFRK